VKRTDHPTDRRATVIQPTMQGKDIGCTMQTEFVNIIGGIYDCLTNTEREQLKAALDKLINTLEKRQQA
jgi:DNA-binding MarR family transcriptional regulator